MQHFDEIFLVVVQHHPVCIIIRKTASQDAAEQVQLKGNDYLKNLSASLKVMGMGAVAPRIQQGRINS